MSLPPHRVVVTGLGCVTPIGSTVDDFRDSLFSGTTGILPLVDVPDMFDPPQLRFSVMAQVRNFDPVPHIDPAIFSLTERTSQFAIIAARQAIQQSAITEHHEPQRTAIILGCSAGGRTTDEHAVKGLYDRNARSHPLAVVRTMANAGASHISIEHHITGPVLNISTACASGTHALGLAYQMVRGGIVSAALAGGHEAALTYGFLRAWDSMRVVSLQGCRPFAVNRDGMTLGEGAAIFALETLDSAVARNAPIFGEIVGFGMTADANHITQPSSTGAAAAMRAALIDASSLPGAPSFESLLAEVGYINAHGTGTMANDSTEAAAIHALFGPGASTIPVSSTKSLHGHSIGATGAVEALATVLALQNGRLPATASVAAADVDPTLNLDIITESPREAVPTLALSNSFAFGGLNAVLAIRPAPQKQ
jgi:3-oxoacyl-[acyl-carrier-protein] synthase II/nodulation protein E